MNSSHELIFSWILWKTLNLSVAWTLQFQKFQLGEPKLFQLLDANKLEFLFLKTNFNFDHMRTRNFKSIQFSSQWLWTKKVRSSVHTWRVYMIQPHVIRYYVKIYFFQYPITEKKVSLKASCDGISHFFFFLAADSRGVEHSSYERTSFSAFLMILGSFRWLEALNLN